MRLTVEQLAEMLMDEFTGWGDLDARWFEGVLDPEYFGDEGEEAEWVEQTRKALEHVVAKINNLCDSDN